MINETKNITLFWDSTEEWQNLTEEWSFYQPYITTRVDNEEN